MSGTGLHATCIAFGPRGALLTGAPGSGKSTLALHLLSAGARLVADDLVHVISQDGQPVASAPTDAPRMIEVRGLGLLSPPGQREAVLHLCIDLDRMPEGRLPGLGTVLLAGHPVPLISGKGVVGLAPAIVLMLREGAALHDPDTPVGG